MLKVVRVLESYDIFKKGITKTAQNEVKSQKGGFLSMLLGASLLGDLLTKSLSGKGIVRAGEGILKKIINATTSFNKF